MLLLRLLSCLPFWALHLVADGLFFVSRYLVGYRTKLVRKNLRSSFPDKSNRELKKIEERFYRNLCDYAVETLKLLTISKEELASRMVFTNLDVIETYKQKGQSVIILGAHQFNWEWLLTAGNFSLPLPVDFVYQKVQNNFFNQFSLRIRTRFGAYAIERENVGRQTLRRKHLQKVIAIIADQYPGHKTDKKYLATFLNQKTVFFQAANQIALLTDNPVVFVEITKLKRGFYQATFRKIAEPPYHKTSNEMIDQYIRLVEESIRKNPDGWLWSHNRWKKRHLKNTASVVNTPQNN